ncbi:trehalose-phosphatase [soil metagenome]
MTDPLKSAEHFNQFFSKLARLKSGALFLDYDGTLAPFHQLDRMKAFPSPGIDVLLHDIIDSGKTRVAFVTGRPVEEIPKLIKFKTPVEIWGSHGREHQDLSGVVRVHGVSDEHESVLDAAWTASVGIPGTDTIERKAGCVAIHWRPASEEMRAIIRREAEVRWRPFIEEHGLEIQVFGGGIELIVPGRSKGDSVDALMENIDPAQTAVAFLGDELPDEDGFHALGDRGLSVIVGNAPRPTLAQARVTLPEGVIEFLRRWRDAVK